MVDVEQELEQIVDMLACHRSQVFEWLPFNRGVLEEVPAEELARRQWFRDWFLAYLRPQADRYRRELIRTYGPSRRSDPLR